MAVCSCVRCAGVGTLPCLPGGNGSDQLALTLATGTIGPEAPPLFSTPFGTGGGGFFNSGCGTTAGAVCAASNDAVGGNTPCGNGGAGFFGFAFSGGLLVSMLGGGFLTIQGLAGVEEGGGVPSTGAALYSTLVSTWCCDTGLAFSTDGKGGGGLTCFNPLPTDGSCRTCALLVKGNSPFDPIGCARSRLRDV